MPHAGLLGSHHSTHGAHRWACTGGLGLVGNTVLVLRQLSSQLFLQDTNEHSTNIFDTDVSQLCKIKQSKINH